MKQSKKIGWIIDAVDCFIQDGIINILGKRRMICGIGVGGIFLAEKIDVWLVSLFCIVCLVLFTMLMAYNYFKNNNLKKKISIINYDVIYDNFLPENLSLDSEDGKCRVSVKEAINRMWSEVERLRCL